MKFRHITRICTCASRSMLPSSRHTLPLTQRYRFSSNLDNEKNNIVPPSTANTKIKSIHDTLQNSLTQNLSFWSFIASNKEHREWVHQYDAEMAKHKAFEFEGDHFSSYRAMLQYLTSNAYNGFQRLRMRGLRLFYYEEFMLGALHSFQAIQTLDSKDKMKISRCFTSNLYDEVEAVQQALFECNEKKKRHKRRYEMANIEAFATDLYFMEGKGSPPDLEMTFNVRYYYSLKNVKRVKKRSKNSDTESSIIHKCADIEWRGYFEPQFTTDGELETFNLSDKGFLVHNVEVDQC